MYAGSPIAAQAGSVALFVAFMCVIVSMYGGGFATVPAYLADMFGTQYVGAIHGRLLTAWSTAGVIGPLAITQIPEYQIRSGVPREQAYQTTLYILAGFLVAGFVCNLLVRPVAERWYMRDADVQPSVVVRREWFVRHRPRWTERPGVAGLGGGRGAAGLGHLDHANKGAGSVHVGRSAMAGIGFIGLGNMGGPMAANLVRAGHAVRGFDLSESARAALSAGRRPGREQRRRRGCRGGCRGDDAAGGAAGAGRARPRCSQQRRPGRC